MAKKILYYDNEEALSFSDVYLYPRYSDIKSRFGKEIDLSTKVALNSPKINVPFISAGMDTVTEYAMASVMALNGGLGEIHRNNTPDEQANQVRIVKERMRIMEQKPPMVSEDAKISDALELLRKRNRGYVLVYEGETFNGFISGIATPKDFISAKEDVKIKIVMTPIIEENGRKLITAKKGTTLLQAVKIMKKNRIEKLPIIEGKNKLFGVYSLKDYQYLEKYPNAALDEQGRLLVGAAIGVHEIDVERTFKVIEAGVDFLFLDIAHGHSIYTKEMLKRLKIKEKIKTPIIAGNFATKEGVLFAYENGADGIKVGIGPGFVCKTRNIAGTGVPQVTAILDVKNALSAKRKAPPIIADGGIREPGDSPKAIIAGGDSIMIGSMLAGTDMSPGDVVKIDGQLQKRIRGMASKGVLEDRKKLSNSTTNVKYYVPEGREVFTPYQGSTENLLNEYIGGLKSAMSYAGSHNIREMQKKQLIHISSSGSFEQQRPLS